MTTQEKAGWPILAFFWLGWGSGYGIILAIAADERMADVSFDQDALSVRLNDGRTVSVPLA
jgi:hypothetical protein